jgi:hypothetical protein
MVETGEEKLPPYVIEGARSSRSRCKSCRRKIEMGKLRIGVLIEGPYGTGYLWHHLKCLARRRPEQVEEAYGLEAWKEAKTPPKKLPSLDELRKLAEESAERKKQRRELPYAEIDPSGRAKCKHCGEPLEKGTVRIVLGREVEFGNQVRTSPIQVHARCVASAIEQDDCSTPAEGFAQALREHSPELPSDRLDAALREIGEIG